MKRSKIAGIVGTLLLHAAVAVFLWLYVLTIPPRPEEGGVPVMLGNTESAGGDADPFTLTQVDVLPLPQEAALPTPEAPQPETPEPETPLITQNDEPTVAVKKETPKEKQKTKDKDKVSPQKTVEQPTDEQLRARRKQQAEQAAAQAASSKIAGAFGKGAKMGSKGNASGIGIQGSPTGNSAQGAVSGVGGYGTFNLNGRSIGPAGLPNPVYNVQDEGRVVVAIVVNPAGKVISTSIDKRTNTVNPALRRAAEEAAGKARFNSISGVDNQSGTITYYFKLK